MFYFDKYSLKKIYNHVLEHFLALFDRDSKDLTDSEAGEGDGE